MRKLSSSSEENIISLTSNLKNLKKEVLADRESIVVSFSEEFSSEFVKFCFFTYIWLKLAKVEKKEGNWKALFNVV